MNGRNGDKPCYTASLAICLLFFFQRSKDASGLIIRKSWTSFNAADSFRLIKTSVQVPSVY